MLSHQTNIWVLDPENLIGYFQYIFEFILIQLVYVRLLLFLFGSVVGVLGIISVILLSLGLLSRVGVSVMASLILGWNLMRWLLVVISFVNLLVNANTVFLSLELLTYFPWLIFINLRVICWTFQAICSICMIIRLLILIIIKVSTIVIALMLSVGGVRVAGLQKLLIAKFPLLVDFDKPCNFLLIKHRYLLHNVHKLLTHMR